MRKLSHGIQIASAMESREQSLTQDWEDDEDVALRGLGAKRVSFREGDGSNRGAKPREDDPEMKVFRLKVYYSEASIDGALKTYPQTKVASIISRTLANRSNFLNNIRKKLMVVGVNPHTRLTLMAVPPVPADRDYSITHWLKKYPNAAMVVSPEDEADSLYRQLLTLNGQPVARNPLYQVEPEEPQKPLSSTIIPTPGTSTLPLSQSPAPCSSGPDGCEGSSSSPSLPTAPLGESSSAKGIGVEGLEKTGAGDTGVVSVSVGNQNDAAGTTTVEEALAAQLREFGELQGSLFTATSQLVRMEKEEASRDLTIQMLEEQLEESSKRVEAMENAESLRKQSYSVRLKEVYRRMFLGCVRYRVRCKLRSLFKPHPSPIDFMAASYNKVLETCDEMEDLEGLLGVKLEDLKLTEKDMTTLHPVHASENIHIGVYAEMVHSQDPVYLPAYRNLFVFLYNQNPQTVLDNLISCWIP